MRTDYYDLKLGIIGRYLDNFFKWLLKIETDVDSVSSLELLKKI